MEFIVEFQNNVRSYQASKQLLIEKRNAAVRTQLLDRI
jgi:hypothetical protein